MKIIDIKNLTYKYDNKLIFNKFNLSVEEGSFITIAGNNNSGKTTLIKLISGLLPNNNTIVIDNSYMNNKRIFDHLNIIGTVYGNNLKSFLFSDVYKEMAYPLENLNVNPSDIEKRIIEVAKFFNASNLLDKKIIDLSNSEKQLLLLMISLLHRPKILLLDNPFSMMDRITKKKIYDKLIDYKKNNGLTIVLATINLEDTIYSDYLYILDNGKIVIEGKPLTVLREDGLINRLGLELPFMVDLSNKLEFYDLIDDIELDMEQLVDKLWK